MNISSKPLNVNIEKGIIKVSGDITQENALRLVEHVTSKPFSVVAQLKFDFDGAQIDDGLGMVVITRTLNALSSRVERVRVMNAPDNLQKALEDADLLNARSKLILVDSLSSVDSAGVKAEPA